MEPIETSEGLAQEAPPRKLALRDLFAALRHRNYRLFFFGQLFSLIGTWMTATAEGWLVYQLTGSKALLGVVTAAATGPMILFTSFGGWLADHYPKRTILLWTQVGAMVTPLTLGVLVWHGSIQTWQIIACALFGGLVMAFDMPARQAFVIEMTSRADLVNAISLNSAAFNGARIVGPSVAGVLMAKFGIATCFILDGLSFLAPITGLLLMRLAPHVPPVRKESILAGVASGVRYVWGSPRLFRIFAVFVLVGTFGMSYSVLMPAIARDTLHAGERAYGLLLASNGVGALAGAFTVAWLGQVIPPRKLALSGVFLLAGSLVLFALTTVLPLAMGLMMLCGYGIVLVFSSSNSTVQLLVEDSMRGRVMGLWSLMFGVAVPVGSLYAGGMAHYFGSTATIITGALLSALVAVWAIWHGRREMRG